MQPWMLEISSGTLCCDPGPPDSTIRLTTDDQVVVTLKHDIYFVQDLKLGAVF